MKKLENSNLVLNAKSLIENETNLVSTLANVSALIHEHWKEIALWTGFYLVQNNQLELGPFQGPIACTTIQKGKGVCGTSWAEKRTIIVKNVHEFEGHIACSSLSNSEIVVPIIENEKVIGVLDIDSEKFDAFTPKHQKDLELICKLISEQFFR